MVAQARGEKRQQQGLWEDRERKGKMAKEINSPDKTPLEKASRKFREVQTGREREAGTRGCGRAQDGLLGIWGWPVTVTTYETLHHCPPSVSSQSMQFRELSGSTWRALQKLGGRGCSAVPSSASSQGKPLHQSEHHLPDLRNGSRLGPPSRSYHQDLVGDEPGQVAGAVGTLHG